MKKQKAWYKRAFKTAVSPLKKYRRNKKFKAFQKKLLSNADQITDWINRIKSFILSKNLFSISQVKIFSQVVENDMHKI